MKKKISYLSFTYLFILISISAYGQIMDEFSEDVLIDTLTANKYKYNLVNDKEVAYDGVIVFAKRKLLKGQSLDISFTADAFAPGLSDEKDYTLRIYYYVKDSVGQVLNKESVLCENKFCKKNTKVECMQTFTAVQDGKYTVYLQSLPDNDMYKRSIKYKKKGNLMLYTYKAE